MCPIQIKKYKHELIRNFSPFNKPGEIDGIIAGNDLDAILSSVFLANKFNWNILGFYDCNKFWYDSKINIREKIINRKLIAVDLDISNKLIPCIGHHILKLKPSDILSGFEDSLNPNLLRNITQQNFTRKYPLGTIHFLRWLFDDEKSNDIFEMLCWLADSSFINAQKYSVNVKEWLDNFLNMDYFHKIFSRVNTKQFENNLQEKVVSDICKIQLCRDRGQTKSRFNSISGHQCRIQDPNIQKDEIKKVMEYICNLRDWKIPKLSDYHFFQGIRNIKKIDKIKSEYLNFNEFLKSENIFSFAITYGNSINYTKFDNVKSYEKMKRQTINEH